MHAIIRTVIQDYRGQQTNYVLRVWTGTDQSIYRALAKVEQLVLKFFVGEMTNPPEIIDLRQDWWLNLANKILFKCVLTDYKANLKASLHSTFLEQDSH